MKPLVATSSEKSMLTIVQGTSKKPVSAERLAKAFATYTECQGFLYIGYPIIGTAEGPFSIDAILVSKSHGIVVFNLVEGRDLGDYQQAQDDSANKLESKLRANRTLMQGRRLAVDVNPVTFAPACPQVPVVPDENYPVVNESNLKGWIDGLSWSSSEHYESLLSVIQAISTIRKGRKRRDLHTANSRGAKLQALEDSIANLDNLQGRAVIETVEGVQRIRGLAGSGKTIVLALKAAYLHAQHPDWKIAVTFNTRSLKGQFKRLINTFTIEQTNEEPDWENIQIIQAWGAPGGGDRDGLYYTFCKTHEIPYYDFGMAKEMFGPGREFEGACITALKGAEKQIELYDAILVDEAQDFPPSFLRLCYEMLKSEKRLVYAYDELQNLSSKPLPPPEKIFGKKADGTPRVRLLQDQTGQPKQDIILEKCYRNSRPVLVTAHALGFGIYRRPDPEIGTGLVQIFDQNDLWKEVGYEVVDGELRDGKNVVLARSENSSPKFLEDHSTLTDLIQFKAFDSQEQQSEWVASQIRENLLHDELRTDDIIVINPNPFTTKDSVAPIRRFLFDAGINSHLAGVDTSPDIFFDTGDDSIAFTGIYRAKGNEAGMVYVINAQDCYSAFGRLASDRNKLFTAITRSKAWVRVLGVGPEMKLLIDEFKKVKANDFSLKFQYPTPQQRQRISIVNRDMTDEERRRVRKGKDELARILDDLEAGRVFPEDLGADQVKRLRSILRLEPNE